MCGAPLLLTASCAVPVQFLRPSEEEESADRGSSRGRTKKNKLVLASFLRSSDSDLSLRLKQPLEVWRGPVGGRVRVVMFYVSCCSGAKGWPTRCWKAVVALGGTLSDAACLALASWLASCRVGRTSQVLVNLWCWHSRSLGIVPV